jgi:type II secretory pathway component PulC
MSFKYFVLNTLLCFAILLIAIKNYETWNHSIGLVPHTGIVPEKSETKNENPPMIASTKEPVSTESYHLLSEKNIFDPERKDFPISTTAVMAEAKKPIVRPQIVLYGVVIAADYQSATVVNPGRPLRRDEREALTLKIGEKIGEYKLAKILPDRIAMENSGDTFEVLLYDSKNPKKRMEIRTETKPVMIASAQPSPVPYSGNPPINTPSQESVAKPKEPVQAQIARPLPFNKHTYQLLRNSADTGGSPQESAGK